MSWTWKVKMFFDRNLNNFLCISEPNYWILKRHMICASVDSYYRSSWIDIIQPKLACICRHVLPIHDYVSQLWYRCGIFGFCSLSFLKNKRKIYKLRQLSLSDFAYFLREACLLFNFWMIMFTIEISQLRFSTCQKTHFPKK